MIQCRLIPIPPRALHIGEPVAVPGFGEAVGGGGVGVPDHAAVDVGLAHLPAHGVEVGLVFGPDLLGEGVGGVVGGGGDVGLEVEQRGEGLAHHGVAVEEEEGAAEQQAQLGFDEAVAEGGRAVGCGEAVHGVGFAQQLAAGGVQGLGGSAGRRRSRCGRWGW